MHITLSLEGWQIHLLHREIINDSWQDIVIKKTFHNIQHSIIWRIVLEFGYKNDEEIEVQNLLSQNTIKLLYTHFPQAIRSRLIATVLEIISKSNSEISLCKPIES